jgi:hypothetical protein
MNNCLECGKEISEVAKYCGQICRQKAYRKRVSQILKAVRENNKPENKARILAERNAINEVPADKRKYPLLPKEVVNKPIIRDEVEPKEGTKTFFKKYGAYTYDALKAKNGIK